MPARSTNPLRKVTLRIFEEDAAIIDAIAATSGIGVNELSRSILNQWATKVRANLKGNGALERPAGSGH